MRFAISPKLAASFVLFCATGCTTYYRVTDQATGRSYYTTDFDRTDSGAVQFQDARSRATITLQSSEILEISRPEFESQTRK
jgi:hypothetical protein